MREIKFRAWWSHPEYNPKGKMYFVGGLYFAKKQDGEPEYDFCGVDEVGLMEREMNCKIGFNTAKECILMQYTGLKDKNGKEIYEGDIVKTYMIERTGTGDDDFRRIPVGFIDFRSGCFQLIADDNKGNKGLNRTLHGTPDIEIIGNVWENPELLK